jgi:hypothetical protein
MKQESLERSEFQLQTHGTHSMQSWRPVFIFKKQEVHVAGTQQNKKPQAGTMQEEAGRQGD